MTTFDRQPVAPVGDRIDFRSKESGLSAWIQPPATLDSKPPCPAMIAVHGVGRNRRSIFEVFAPLCRSMGILLIAPRFSRRYFSGYQRCRPGRLGIAPDQAMAEVVDYAYRVTGANPIHGQAQKVRLFGFSGGAQFAHRWVLRGGPISIERLTLCAAGFYSLPDPDLDFPFGIRTSRQEEAIDANRLATTPTRVFVGSEDQERDPNLQTSGGLDHRQGHNRVERAENFVVSMRVHSCQQRLTPGTTLKVLPGGQHSFLSCVDAGLDRAVMEFLYPELALCLSNGK